MEKAFEDHNCTTCHNYPDGTGCPIKSLVDFESEHEGLFKTSFDTVSHHLADFCVDFSSKTLEQRMGKEAMILATLLGFHNVITGIAQISFDFGFMTGYSWQQNHSVPEVYKKAWEDNWEGKEKNLEER